MTQKSEKPLRLARLTEPTLQGRLGKAWLVDMVEANRRRGFADNDPKVSVTLPGWVVSAPYAHPVWSHYWISCISLRDVPGLPPAKINLAGATHEVFVFALNPRKEVMVNEYPDPLMPANFIGQFVEESDASASARVQQAVQDVIDGTLNPDTDFLWMWVKRFSGSNLKKEALTPDFLALVGGDLLASGTGSGNARALQQIAEVSATLKADESKPQ